MSSRVDMRWKQDFPIPSQEDSYVTRREFTKFLGLTSLAFFLGTFTAAARKLWKRAAGTPAAGSLAPLGEKPVGGDKLLSSSPGNKPCHPPPPEQGPIA